MAKERIFLDMTFIEVVTAIAGGNPGAVNVCCMLFEKGGDIDPDSILGGFSNLLSLDTLGIYGHRIWGLYKDVCGENLEKMVGVLRANQLGYLSSNHLRLAIDDRQNIDVDDLLKQVKEHLPNFGQKDK